MSASMTTPEPGVQNDRYIPTLPLDELAPGAQAVWKLGLQRILLCRTLTGNVQAMLDVCPHARQPIAGGVFNETSITCPKHGACFDIRSGKPLNGVTSRVLQVLPARVRDGVIEVALVTAVTPEC